jgi:hypothetical protein
VKEIDISAFDRKVWPLLQFDGPPPFAVTPDFLCSSDSRILFGRFLEWSQLDIPSSVEILVDRCFEYCRNIETIRFQESSKLRRIGERALAGCPLTSITIPASTEEIDGSAFVGCPIAEIRIAPGSQSFKTEGHLLMTSDGTKLVRYFGRKLEVKVPVSVEILGNSCFERCDEVARVVFETGSHLVRICRSALCKCTSVTGIEIPASVEVIEEAAFKGCRGLESCVIAGNSSLVRIEKEAFSKCCSLRSFYIPIGVEAIGEKCFNKCYSLHRLRFVSNESVKKFVGDLRLDEALENIGFAEISSVFRMEFDEGGVPLDFPGWSPKCDGLARFALV